MYLIPKNIKVKKEIFKGFGILEILAVVVSISLGYVVSMLGSGFYSKAILFCIFPLTTLILLIPLPNGSTVLNIFLKFIKYQKNQKKYKKYEEEINVKSNSISRKIS